MPPQPFCRFPHLHAKDGSLDTTVQDPRQFRGWLPGVGRRYFRYVRLAAAVLFTNQGAGYDFVRLIRPLAVRLPLVGAGKLWANQVEAWVVALDRSGA